MRSYTIGRNKWERKFSVKYDFYEDSANARIVIDANKIQ